MLIILLLKKGVKRWHIPYDKFSLHSDNTVTNNSSNTGSIKYYAGEHTHCKLIMLMSKVLCLPVETMRAF